MHYRTLKTDSILRRHVTVHSRSLAYTASTQLYLYAHSSLLHELDHVDNRALPRHHLILNVPQWSRPESEMSAPQVHSWCWVLDHDPTLPKLVLSMSKRVSFDSPGSHLAAQRYLTHLTQANAGTQRYIRELPLANYVATVCVICKAHGAMVISSDG